MQNKINIAELLKNCPKGMELDCMLLDNLTFDHVGDDGIWIKHIDSKSDEWSLYINNDGSFPIHNLGSLPTKCVIFPKGKTTWEGFVPPFKFKAGDVLVSESGNIVLLSHIDSENVVHYHCIIPTHGSFRIEENTEVGVGRYYDCVLANEQQRQRMYDKIKCSGHKYNQSTNKLEKLTEFKFKVGDRVTNGKISITIGYLLDNEYYDEIGRNISNMLSIKNQDSWVLVSNKLVEPKFKVGYRIVKKNSVCVPILITKVSDEFYYFNTESSVGVLPISKQDNYELVPNKFDTTTLVPFESRVLVRDCNSYEWEGEIFTRYAKSFNNCNFVTLGGQSWKQCIPYNDNTKHLLGITDDCDEFYKTWE